MQITCLIVGPVFWSATLYIILGILITHAPHKSLLPAKLYLIIFCLIDLLSLILQAIGGGIAAGATKVDIQNRGTNIMVAGILVQIAGMSAFVTLATIFIARVWQRRKVYGVHKSVLSVLVISTLLIFLRNIYRCVGTPRRLGRIRQHHTGIYHRSRCRTDVVVLDHTVTSRPCRQERPARPCSPYEC